jgi:hypothetical protein
VSQHTSNHSFDELARGLASGSITRGKALRLMGAALVGGTLAPLGVGGVAEADDECKRTGKKCRKNKQCCSGNCSGGTCAACASEQVLCNGSCVSTSCSTGQIFDPSSCACVYHCPDVCYNTPGCCGPGSICNLETGECDCVPGLHCTSAAECCGGQFCINSVCTP